ncbi:hypothetical protein [Marivirga lumbricoides]
MKTIYILSLICLVMVSCTSSSENISAAEKTFEEAIKIHDEVMPKMDKIESLKLKLKEFEKSHPEDSTQIDSQIKKLDNVSEAMMMWMHELKIYPQQSDEASHDGHHMHNSQADTTYQVHIQQKAEIIIVQQLIYGAIQEAEEFMKSK